MALPRPTLIKYKFLLLAVIFPFSTAILTEEWTPLITPAPLDPLNKLKARQGPGSNVIGYTYYNGYYYPGRCVSDSTVSESSDFFACVPTTATSFGIATACLQSSLLVVPPFQLYTCNGQCYTMLLFTDHSDTAPHSAFACHSHAVLSYYLTTTDSETSTVADSVTGISVPFRPAPSTTRSVNGGPDPVSTGANPNDPNSGPVETTSSLSTSATSTGSVSPAASPTALGMAAVGREASWIVGTLAVFAGTWGWWA
ncbi:hypothetical protein BU16DRAFT_522625 [Lophium mytilinum]|uniref:WSC domain-containing protein n=1 Tax=Lophium mytilinum TaxID=390894 RepID=A0A6A6RE38_9PEZI|nr:hypothetical protein BU16DRAFT_522625 [Lophium mytilinum]